MKINRCTIYFVLSVLLLLIVNPLDAQSIRDRSADVFSELEDNKLTLRFFNALDGTPISKANVNIKNLGEFVSDHEGKVLFPIPQDGILQITFSKSGFITSTFNIEVMAGTLFFNRFSVSPSLPLGSVRIVLDWGEKPRDLDAHLIKQNGYHISYRNKKISADGIAQLDRDDTDGFGPETITTSELDQNSIYYYFVHNYSNKNIASSTALSNSRAGVKVYGGDNQLLEVFQAPLKQMGNYWHVFKIVNDKLVPVMEINTKPKQF